MGAFRTAYVYVRNAYAGALSETDEGYSFEYDRDYLRSEGASAVSLTLPLSEEVYSSKTLFSFFDAGKLNTAKGGAGNGPAPPTCFLCICLFQLDYPHLQESKREHGKHLETLSRKIIRFLLSEHRVACSGKIINIPSDLLALKVFQELSRSAHQSFL